MNKAQLREIEQQPGPTFAEKCAQMDNEGLAGRWYQQIDRMQLYAFFWNSDNYICRQLAVFYNGRFVFYATPETWNDLHAMKILIDKYCKKCNE